MFFAVVFCQISSLALLGDEFSGFVKFRKPFRDFNGLIADMWLHSWCFVSAACLNLSERLETVRLMSGGAMSASRCRLFKLVDRMQSIIMRQNSCRAGLSLFARVDLAHTSRVFGSRIAKFKAAGS